MIIGLCKASNEILDNNVNNSKQLSNSSEGEEVLLVVEALSKISKREATRTTGSVSLLVVGMVEGMSKRLASLASKMSTSSIDMVGTERARGEGREGCIGIGEEEKVSLVVAIVLATSKSREEGLELDKISGQGTGEQPVSSL